MNIFKTPLDRRRLLQYSAAIGAASTLPFAPTAQAAQKKGGTMRMGKAHGQTTDSLDPGVAENGFTTALMHGTHGFLTEVGKDGTLQPNLAESWEASDDAASWRFKLRKDVTYHNGKTLDVNDVIAAINHHRGEKSTSAAGPIVKPITKVYADGDDTVVFDLEAGNADFPFVLSDYHLAIVPAKDGKADWQSGVGCGPYKLDSFKPGITAELSRHGGYWADDRAFFDEIEMLALVDLNARTTALITGDVDACDRLDLKTVGLLARRPQIQVHSVTGTQHFTFAMATNQKPFDDVNVRLALKYGIDRQEMVDKILFGYGEVGNDHPIGSGQRYYNKDLAQREYDPDKAKFHLKKAGLDSLAVDLSAADAAFGGAVDAAVLYQNSASKAGIDITVKREPNDGYWADVWMKKPFCAVYWSGRPVEDQMFSTAYASGASWNDTFWEHARFNELLVAARAELDDEKRRAMYYEMQEILHNDGGTVIPMFAAYVFATNDKLDFGGDFATNWALDGERWMERWSFA